MSDLVIGYLSFPILLVLIFLRAPICLAMLICGIGGLWMTTGGTTVFMARLKSEVYTTFSGYTLSIIPMFLLMGQFATQSGMSRALFRAAGAWLGHLRGGMAMSAIVACAGFGAICGSSLATAATMSKTALPELRKFGYSGGFSTATLAAGGTLGILIPPSVILVIYAILAEQNISKLFLAAVVPGLLAMLGYMLTVAIYARLYPDAAGTRPRMGYAERFRALVAVWPVLIVFLLVVGGIYRGWFTPTEGAAVGALGTGIVALFSGVLSWSVLRDSLIETATGTGMIYFIVFGAAFYNGFLAITGVPQELSRFVASQGLNPWMIMVLILLFYLVLGCLMDSLSMVLLTVPILWPVVQTLDFGLTPEGVGLWFGILVLIVVEVGLITPPVGMNLFIINSMDGATPMTATYRAVLFFVASDILRVGLLLAFPVITLAAVDGRLALLWPF